MSAPDQTNNLAGAVDAKPKQSRCDFPIPNNRLNKGTSEPNTFVNPHSRRENTIWEFDKFSRQRVRSRSENWLQVLDAAHRNIQWPREIPIRLSCEIWPASSAC